MRNRTITYLNGLVSSHSKPSVSVWCLFTTLALAICYTIYRNAAVYIPKANCSYEPWVFDPFVLNLTVDNGHDYRALLYGARLGIEIITVGSHSGRYVSPHLFLFLDSEEKVNS